jgi:adenylate cyclase
VTETVSTGGLEQDPLRLADLAPQCFGGIVPVVFATTSAAGIPNVTFISRILPVDEGRIALSNQFMSKSRQNLAEVPTACLMLVRPDTHEEYRIWIEFEQTVRQGPVFDRLRNELALIAALTRMQDVFKLRAADVFRVTRIEQVRLNDRPTPAVAPSPERFGADHAALGELCSRISRCSDLDGLVRVVLAGLDELLGYPNSILLLADEQGARLFTIGSHGYERAGTGAEVAIGDGTAGLAAERCAPVNLQNSWQMARYARRVRSGFEAAGELEEGCEVPMPGLPQPGSQLAVPALALGELIGVLLAESPRADDFSDRDVAALTVVSSLVASVIERLRSEVRVASATVPEAAGRRPSPAARPLSIRHFAADGSTFLDNEYLIKGVAGKLFWALVRHYIDEGRVEFTNREMRLDPSLDLPDFRDNFESRLILLKRRLEDRSDPIQIHKSGRGRFGITVDRPLTTELVG